MSFVCRLCGKDQHQTGGYLQRVNEKGVEGVWECRPDCEVKLSDEEALLLIVDPGGCAPPIFVKENQ